MKRNIILVLLLACAEAVAGPRGHRDYEAEVKNPEKRLPILAEARQFLRQAEATETNRTESLALCLNRCEQLLWVRPDDVFAEALVILAEATWLKGQPDRALQILKEYDKILKLSGISTAKKGVSFSERADYQAEALRGRIHEQKGMAALQTKDQDAARVALTESWRCFASAAALAGRGVDCPAARKAEEVKALIPIMRIHPLDIQTNTANQAHQDTSLRADPER
jgi:hypothetical protein